MSVCEPCTQGNHSGTNGTPGCQLDDCTCRCRATSSDLCVAVSVVRYGDEPCCSAAIVVDGLATSFECPHAHRTAAAARRCALAVWDAWREWCDPETTNCDTLSTSADGVQLVELSRELDGERQTRRMRTHLPGRLVEYVAAPAGEWT